MTCPAPVKVTAYAMATATKALHLLAEDVQHKAALRWARGRGLAEYSGCLGEYLHAAAVAHGSVPRVHRRQVWWYVARGSDVVCITVELVRKPLWHQHLAELANREAA